MKNYLGTKTFRNLFIASALVTGVVSYGVGSINPVVQSHAQAVKVETPAIFSFADVVEVVSPAVVSVRVEASIEPANDQGEFEGYGRRFFEEFFRNGPRGGFAHPRRKGPHATRSQGSGFFVSEDGYIVTNHHVIANGSKFTVVTSDGNELDAELVGADQRTDLAVLKVKADHDFTYVDFGPERPRIGEWVVAVGNPFGLGGTVTAGIVSAHGREIGASRYDDFIQIDAAVNKGNSGGPAFNLRGEVVGVNTAIFSPSGGNVGIAFAIPATLADEIVSDLITNGSVARGWLGVSIQPLTSEISDALGIELSKGAIVTSAMEDSPAAEADVKAGDIITEIDGNQITGPKELARVIAGYEPGSEIEMTYLRDGEEKTIPVKLGNLNSVDPTEVFSNARTIKLKRLGLALKQTENGLRITEVKPGSRAGKRGLRPGDIIISINGEEISTSRELREQLKRAQKSGRKGALLQIERGKEILFIPVPVAQG